ncbi:MAG TPA: efflux RND transporter periplasmic adaptor subunit [Anaerolineae bacterium]|nr:efflux RND transporter periplasmic adaptor subunit [Anaerolineales bacterium]HRV93839.1 efflux RND transporter periplasmic adaptor subunit [Anaerolineae bacterium]
MKRVVIITLILAATIGISLAGYYYAAPMSEPPALTDDPSVEIVPVETKTLVDTVNAAGQIRPKAEVEMKFEIGGVIEEVLVKRGQPVEAGTVLARLATDDLELAVQKADIDLAKQEAELEKLLEPEMAAKIASARAKVESARLKLAELQDGPDPDEVTKAESDLALKQIELKKAQWAYDQVAYRGDIGAMSESDELQSATLEYETAVADYNLAVKAATEAELAEARATMVGNEAELAEVLQGPSAAEIASVKADVDKSRLALQEARDNLKEAVLVAPIDGIILSIDIEPGERVLNEADDAVMVVADTSSYLLEVEIDEIDIGRIARSQDTTITLDAFPDETFTGQVVDIAPSPTDNDSGGIVTYEVVVEVAAADGQPSLLPGMTATAAIETRRLEDVMVIPNQAIQIDRDASPSIIYVEKINGDEDPMRVEIELGLRDGDMTEVVAGLEAGDEVIIRKQPPESQGPSL